MENEGVRDLYDAKFGAGSDTQAFVEIELIFGIKKANIVYTERFLIIKTSLPEKLIYALYYNNILYGYEKYLAWVSVIIIFTAYRIGNFYSCHR